MLYKNIRKLFTVLFFISLTSNAHAQMNSENSPLNNAGGTEIKNLEVIFSGGYSNYAIRNSTSQVAGFHIDTSFLKSFFEINDNIDLLAGLNFKYEQVQQSKSRSGIFGYNSTQKFSSLPLGFETGVKFNLSPLILYETFVASYGIYNSLNTEITNGDIFIPDQTVTATVHNSYNAGLNTRALYAVSPTVSVGVNFYIGYGNYDYDGSTVQTAAGAMPTNSGSETFTNMNAGLVAAVRF